MNVAILPAVVMSDAATDGPSVADPTFAAAASASLERTLQAIEGAFLKAGSILSDAVDGVGELITGLDRLTAAVDPEVVEASANELNQAANHLRDLPNYLAARRTGLEELVGNEHHLGASIAEMKRSLSYLRVYAVYVKVAAAGIPDQGHQFDAFAQEITECIAGGRSHVDALERDLATLDSSLQAALRVEQDVAHRCADMLLATPNAILATAKSLAEHRGRVAAAAASVRQLASNVRRKVGAVLAALQVGDSTRQRLEHVLMGLGLIERLGNELEPEPRARFVAVGRELLGALLLAASEDFYSEIGQIGRSMKGLADDAADILRQLNDAYGQRDTEGSGFLVHLEGHVRTALDLVDDVRASDEQAAALGQSAAEAALSLGRRIDDVQLLQRDVQQMALNTRLKCSQIGADGRSLAVIALELREQATEMEASATRALAAIETLNHGASRLVDAATESGERGALAASRSLNQVLGRLGAAGEGLNSDPVALARLGSSVVESLQQAASGIDFQIAVGGTLDDALSAISPPLGQAPQPDASISGQIAELLESLAKSYTMVQERDVHRVVAAALGVEGRLPEAEAPPVEELDDLLF